VSLSGYDAWATGGRYSREIVEVVCKRCEANGVETMWLDTLESEYGAQWLNAHEECPVCGADGDELNADPADPADYDPRVP
jgi:hypothetical protein